MPVREIRVGLVFVGSPELPLTLPVFSDVDWRDLRVEVPSSILLSYVEDLVLVNGQL